MIDVYSNNKKGKIVCPYIRCMLTFSERNKILETFKNSNKGEK